MDEMNLSKAKEILFREFGSEWPVVAAMVGTEQLRHRVGKDFTSFLAFPERGIGGNNKWPGNCSPEVIKKIIAYCLSWKQYNKKDVGSFTVLDPMSGSGTTKAAADSMQIKSVLYDLNPSPPAGTGNWNALKDDIDDSADCIFFHPPYHSMIQYSGKVWGKRHPEDLSCCDTYGEFIDKLNEVIKRLYMALRKDGRLAVLVGDFKRNGVFHCISRDIMDIGTLEASIVKTQFNCNSDSKSYGQKPFIPIVHENLLIFRKPNSIIIDFSQKFIGSFNIMEKDDRTLTWFQLIRMTVESYGGETTFQELYRKLENHPKAQKNKNYRDRIRATVYEHPHCFDKGGGNVRLSYKVA